jgi:hypothetical protein
MRKKTKIHSGENKEEIAGEILRGFKVQSLLARANSRILGNFSNFLENLLKNR